MNTPPWARVRKSRERGFLWLQIIHDMVIIQP